MDRDRTASITQTVAEVVSRHSWPRTGTWPEHNRELRFVDLFLVEPGQGHVTPIAEPGDSGSVVVDADNHAVGLLPAADPGGTFYYAHPIRDVLNELEIDLLV